MKVIQVFMEDSVHGDFKSWCAKKGTSMQRQVNWWVKNECFGGGLGVGSTDGDAQRGVAKARSKTVKDTLDVPSESKSPTPNPRPEKPKPVSEFLCKECGKPTGGSFLCDSCKKL